MRTSSVALGVGIALLVVFVSCAANVQGTRPAPVSGFASGRLAIDAVPVPLGTPVVPLPPPTALSLTFTLANPNAAEIAQRLVAVEDPGSPEFRHFLTFPEYLATLAPPPSEASEVDSALVAAGASDISNSADRSFVTAVLPAGQVERWLGVSLVVLVSGVEKGAYTAVGVPQLPRTLVGLVDGIGGLSNAATKSLDSDTRTLWAQPRPLVRSPSEFVYAPQFDDEWYFGSDYAQAYDATRLFPGAGSVANATFPTSTAIATLLGSSWNQTTGNNLPPWDPTVVFAYFNGTLGPGWPLPTYTGVPVPIDGETPPAPGSLGSWNDSLNFENENSLDLEMAGSLAPGASLYNFYFAGSLVAGEPTNGDVADYFAADLASALAYNYGSRHLTTISCSFGLGDLNDSAWDTGLATAALLGVTVLASSGDQANAPDSVSGRGDGPWPVWPATSATNTTGTVAVGGVTLALSGSPTSDFDDETLNLSYDPSAGTIASQSVWYDTTAGVGNYEGTEGGASPVVPEPYWQYHSAAQPAVANAAYLQGADALGRAVPDLAMPANNTIATIAANATDAVFFNVFEGTSVAAPVLAGLLADVVAVENNRTHGPWTSLGFVTPEIYRIASYFAAHSSAPGDPFLDVTTGHNYVFSAAPGWDATTGWGGVNAVRFLAADANASVRDYQYTGPTPGLPAGHSSSGGSTVVPWLEVAAVGAVTVIVVLAVLLVVLRRPRTPSSVSGVPWGAHLSGAPPYPAPPQSSAITYPGATFPCPYCGGVRPAGSARCPQCGAG